MEELKYISNTPYTSQSPWHFSYQPKWLLNPPFLTAMCRFNITFGITLEKAEQNLVCREFSKQGAFKYDDPNPFAYFLFLMERPFVPYTMLPSISAVSSGHFCSLSLR